MQTLRPQAPEVPHHVRVFHVGLGIALLGVDEGRELHGVNGGGRSKLYILHSIDANKNVIKCVSDHFCAAV